MARQRSAKKPAQAQGAGGAASTAAEAATPAASAAEAAQGPPAAAPPETVRGDTTVPWLATMMFLAPALGVPVEEMLQDTLKSIVVAFFALGSAALFFWRQRDRAQPLRWHAVMWLPLALAAYAAGSMVWSHTYLAGVETVRWVLFSLLVWLGLNTLARDRVPTLAWGIHAGAVVAALWAALQFWFDMRLFPQGPHPASTFVNRNFFAEFAVSTLPFGALLVARARSAPRAAALAASVGLVIVSILMTGTRAALVALWLQVLVVFPIVGWKCREQFAFSAWSARTRALVAGTLLATVAVLGAIPSTDQMLLDEGRGSTALARGLQRTQSIRPDDSSLGIRMVMWRATINLIQQRPFTGVGAGAWESDIPLYQAEGSQIETDYYAHNEFLQLVAEYGVVGQAFLLYLAAWLLRCAWRNWNAATPEAKADVPFNAVALCSLLALFIVSNVGFPWRMAATGALFALCLAVLAASEARRAAPNRWGAVPIPWSPRTAKAALAATAVCAALAMVITQRAVESEFKIVRATKIALTISNSGDPHNPQWDPVKVDMLALMREGIDLNRHYRKITPIVGDELAKWGDWTNALWIWESVLSSRPYVVAILCNVARAYASTGNPQKGWEYLQRAKRIQPRAPAVRSLEVVLLSRAGQNDKALQLAREAIVQNMYDYDLVNAAFILAWRALDEGLVLKAMELRMNGWPESRVAGYMQLGTFYATGMHDEAKAMGFYRQGLALATPQQLQVLSGQIPPQYLSALGLPAPNQQPTQPPARPSERPSAQPSTQPGSQTSSSSR